MFGISLPEIAVICLVLLLVVGPERMPEATKKAAHFLGKFRNQTDSMRRELYNTMYTPAKEISRDIEKAKTSLVAVKTELSNSIAENPRAAVKTVEEKGPSEEPS
jgi:Sec-independent protein translocase protein TatA